MRTSRPSPLLTHEERQEQGRGDLFSSGTDFVDQVEKIFLRAYEKLSSRVGESDPEAPESVLDMCGPTPDGKIVCFPFLEVAEGPEGEFARDLVELLWAAYRLLEELRKKRPNAGRLAPLSAEFGARLVTASARRQFEMGLATIRGGAKAGRLKSLASADLKAMLLQFAEEFRESNPGASDRTLIAGFQKELKRRGATGRKLRTYQDWLTQNRAHKR